MSEYVNKQVVLPMHESHHPNQVYHRPHLHQFAHRIGLSPGAP